MHEITESDGVVFVGERPWHGIGKEVDPNISAHEAMMEAGLNWRVGKSPLYNYNPTTQSYQQLEGHVAIKRTDNGAILGITTPRYEPYQNEEAFTVFQRVLDTGLAKIETAGSLKGGKIVWALAHIQTDDLAVCEGDLVRAYALLSTGHDGRRGIKVGYVPTRVVCWNTLSAAEASDESRLVRVAHKGNVKESVEMLVDALDLSVREFRASVSDYKRMLNTPINQEDLREYVRVTLGLVESADNKRASNVIDKVVGYANDGIGNASIKGTVWAALNGITQWLSHDAGRNADNRYASMWFGNNKQVLRDAHDNAMKRVA